jgi:sarcosine oxidase subunit gamma
MNAHSRFAVPDPVMIDRLPLAARFSLRLTMADRGAASAALGLDLPDRIGQIATKGSRRAICLGPDEWQLDAAASEVGLIRSALAAIYPTHPHSLVEITDREVTFRLSGPQAAELVSVASPRDPVLMPPGTGARTIFDVAQAVLIREADDVFTLTIWNSFAPHVAALLAIANTELAAGL